MDLGDPADVEHELREAAQARRARSTLDARLAQARGDAEQADVRLGEADLAQARESADVEALESWSPTRIWAGLRGSRDLELSREQSELRAAQYALAVAEQRRDAARAEVARVEAEIDALGEVDERYRAALQAQEDRLVASGTGSSGELAGIARRRGELDAERREIDEADAAGHAAFIHLDAAVQLLEKARSWSSWDTFGGGGMLTDAIKYDRMDQAAAALREADQRLRHLRVELADVDLSGVPEVGVDGLLKTFDVWFDNIFSDWSVRNRIADALQAATRARDDVQRVAGVLAARRSETAAEAGRLEARRTAILTGER